MHTPHITLCFLKPYSDSWASVHKVEYTWKKDKGTGEIKDNESQSKLLLLSSGIMDKKPSRLEQTGACDLIS